MLWLMKMIKETIRNFILKIPHYIGIALKLHSKSPTKEIKKLWKIIAISGLFVVFLTLFSGVKIFGFIPSLKIDFINNNGGFIFFIFIVVFVIVFFDYEECKNITSKQYQKNSNT